MSLWTRSSTDEFAPSFHVGRVIILSFVSSRFSYPVILSIENHCSVPQQKKMAQYLIEILGDKLDLANIKADGTGRLPSPEILRGKILVKVPSKVSSAVDSLILCGEKNESRGN